MQASRPMTKPESERVQEAGPHAPQPPRRPRPAYGWPPGAWCVSPRSSYSGPARHDVTKCYEKLRSRKVFCAPADRLKTCLTYSPLTSQPDAAHSRKLQHLKNDFSDLPATDAATSPKLQHFKNDVKGCETPHDKTTESRIQQKATFRIESPSDRTLPQRGIHETRNFDSATPESPRARPPRPPGR